MTNPAHPPPRDPGNAHVANANAKPVDPNADLGFELPPPVAVSPTRIIAIGLVVLAVVGSAFVVGYMPRRKAKEDLAAATKADVAQALRVEVVAPKVASSDKPMILPGTVHPLEETTVYSRANGYVRTWKVDLGDKVKEGDLLAEIDTPELDQQIDQARAQLAQTEATLLQAKANEGFSKTNRERYEALAPSGVASQQELDKSRAQSSIDEATVRVAEANIEAQKANLRRAVQLKSFARIVAPFGGTVTSRSIERGTLVSGTTALYKIAALDPMRVMVSVPQDVAVGVRAEVPAKVNVREYPGRPFEGKVSRAAGALDPMSRTMVTEVRVPNPKNELLGGMYAQVELTLPLSHKVLEIPATALLSDANGLRVAIVKDDTIHLQSVILERDTGPTLVIASGLAETDRVVKIASAELVEGRAVAIAAPAAAPSPGGGAAPAGSAKPATSAAK